MKTIFTRDCYVAGFSIGALTDDTVYAVVEIKYLSILLHTPVCFVRRIAHHAGTFPKPPPVLVHQRVLNDL